MNKNVMTVGDQIPHTNNMAKLPGNRLPLNSLGREA